MRRFRSWTMVLTMGFFSIGTENRSSAGVRGQAGGARPVPIELQSYVERFTGPRPTDCGLHSLVRPFETASVEELQRSVTCGIEAAKGQKAFWAFTQLQGIDSLVFNGLLGTADGIIFRFSYDSAPCGNPSCPGKFNIERCERPAIVTNRGSGADFRCQR